MTIIQYLNELRLYGGRVYALVVEEYLHLIGDANVVREVLAADVGRGNDSVAGQLPDVKLVHRNHPLHLRTSNYNEDL